MIRNKWSTLPKLLTKVIFRWLKEEEVIAILIEEIGDNTPYTCLSYSHLKQYQICNPVFIINTSYPIDLSDTNQSYLYRCLYEELIDKGYRLEEVYEYNKEYFNKRDFITKRLSTKSSNN
jgi:hypothetical protein